MSDLRKVAIVILAAGGSSRMGRPKQLLPVDGVPLLQKVVDAARRLNEGARGLASTTPVFVVLGAHREEIESNIDFELCTVLQNANWHAGMSTSIVTALKHIQKELPDATGVLLVMADQPWVSSEVLAALIAKHEESGLPVIVSSYSNRHNDDIIAGPPAFFARELFPELLKLEGDNGARKVVLAHKDRMGAVDFPLGAIDIDTQADYTAVLAAI